MITIRGPAAFSLLLNKVQGKETGEPTDKTSHFRDLPGEMSLSPLYAGKASGSQTTTRRRSLRTIPRLCQPLMQRDTEWRVVPVMSEIS